MTTEAPNHLPPRNSPRATHPAVGALLLLLGLAWSAYLVHQILTVKGAYSYSFYEERTIQDNVRLAAPFLVLALTYVIVGLGVVCRWRWTRVPAMLLLALALVVLGGFALLFLFLKKQADNDNLWIYGAYHEKSQHGREKLIF